MIGLVIHANFMEHVSIYSNGQEVSAIQPMEHYVKVRLRWFRPDLLKL